MENTLTKSLVDAVKKHARANYNKGWDIVIETMGNVDIDRAIGSATTEAGAIRNVARLVNIKKEQRREVQAQAEFERNGGAD